MLGMQYRPQTIGRKALIAGFCVATVFALVGVASPARACGYGWTVKDLVLGFPIKFDGPAMIPKPSPKPKSYPPGVYPYRIAGPLDARYLSTEPGWRAHPPERRLVDIRGDVVFFRAKEVGRVDGTKLILGDVTYEFEVSELSKRSGERRVELEVRRNGTTVISDKVGIRGCSASLSGISVVRRRLQLYAVWRELEWPQLASTP